MPAPSTSASPTTFAAAAIEQALAAITFDTNGLVPCVAQQHDSGEVLMMAWMNRESVAETLRTGRVCYWSRARSALWRKGETSGHGQTLVDLRIDCDGDTLLALVDQTGVACHTGRHNCFFRALRNESLAEIAPVLVDPKQMYGA
ncbi:MAG TPA: phosphoribosyl-AMP cyclohydrolase [Vineibacter sp.]|nr:phosphoribosyl-AMP cyclohydrolase [Vineibacter sp.]